ncbi:hypothetical protein E1I69_11365 [Bacillus timonensis]|uniref:Uncharacterized protein n=1 Tax=Bacillus timonensis TaxID=1033734 RepID=A0A4S3PSA6_9BACI|nr:hypothetical protein [Bacillus timonensis]THE12294.1 hypothetical protein E1I69_11365 [Bacillus timonensis]
MSKNKKQDENEEVLKWLDEEDPFGLNEEDVFITFKCIDCGKEDEVPDFVVEEFAFDLKKGEVVEVVCPFCEGTMREARKDPK